jgi:hypothetical protein
MENQIIVGVFLFFTLISCKEYNTQLSGDNQEKQSVEFRDSLNKLAMEAANSWYLADTIFKIPLSDTTFLWYKFNNEGAYHLEWGSSTFRNTSKQLFEILGSGNLGLRDFNEKVILLSQGCGTSCTYFVFLPMHENATEKIYNFAYTYNLENQLVAFIPVLEKWDRLNVRIENYQSGRHFDIAEADVCPAAFSGDCIDTCYFVGNDKFVLNWEGTEWKSEQERDVKEKVYPFFLE